MRTASRAGLGALALATTALLSACGGDDTTTSNTAERLSTTSTAAPASTSTTAAGAGTSSSSTTTAGWGATTTAAGTNIDVVYKDGKVQGSTKYSVKKGERMSIKVTADISDEVHVHGYDKTANVTPSTPAVLSFIADRQGKYEVEFEKKHSLIFELEVR